MIIRSRHSTYSCAAHDEVLRAWHGARCAKELGPLHLDLSSASFFDPYGIVALVLFLNHLPHEALPVRLQLEGFEPGRDAPDRASQGVASYLTRMGFWEEVGARLDSRPEALPVRSMWGCDKNVLIDVTILHGRDAVGVMIRKTGEILSALGFLPIARGHVMEVLSELSSNVLDHAQAEFGGVVTTQTYRARGSGSRYLVMSIGDAGIGVRSSLSANAALRSRLESDAQALGVCVQSGCSRFGAGGRGGGLPRVLDIARRYDGSVALRSGEGALAFRGGAHEANRIFEAPFQTGTQLRIMLPEAGLLG